MRDLFGIGLIMLGVMGADSDSLIVPVALIVIGLVLIRRKICSK